MEQEDTASTTSRETRNHGRTHRGSWAMLTGRDRSLIVALARSVKLLSVQQVARSFFTGSTKRRCERRVRELELAGWLTVRVLIARPGVRAPERPWFRWSRGEQHLGPVMAGKIAYALERRWRGLEMRPTKVLSSTSKAAGRFSGHASTLRQTDIDHDLVTSEVFLRWSLNDDATTWVSEHQLKQAGPWGSPGVPLPDAAVVDQDGELTAIESAGSYSKAKLLRYHRRMAALGVPYELY